MIRTRLIIASFIFALSAGALSAQDHQHPAGDSDRLGAVSFAVSCAPGIQPRFERAVAMLHSFWFDAAEKAFSEIIAADPTCAMAHWGRAINLMGNPMTRATPPPAALAAGLAAAERARELAARTSSREQMYADAAIAFYRDHGSRTHAAAMQALERAFAAVAQAHPEDMEAAIFHGRTIVANAPPDDGTFARLIAGADMLQPLFDRNPDHPGLAHYLIHAYDVPQLADRGTAAAKVYAGIAPTAPHALHMPSHIFTRLGHWDESIETNQRSAQAEPDPNGAVHPMDYMVYAFLQQGRDAAAREVVDRAVQNSDQFYGGLLGYNFTAMPARYALERSRWSDAAQLRLPVNALPYVEAVTRFARAVGAGRSGAAQAADVEVQALAALQARLEQGGDAYWARVVEAQRLAAAAWVARARGDDAAALQLAADAAALEDRFEKHPVTPGPLLPARELYADLLLELGRAPQAQLEYEAVLKREPRRARALHGAARAAELAGSPAAAAHYAGLVDVMTKADSPRPELEAARRFLAVRK